VPLGYNDDPVTPRAGSAIFLHLVRPDYAATAGCVALSREALLEVIATADAQSRVIVLEAGVKAG
jgi:L,D-peptidoglycan transpeptidase YkuD (ErfK/YbiS/YcfS/YnhG family)